MDILKRLVAMDEGFCKKEGELLSSSPGEYAQTPFQSSYLSPNMQGIVGVIMDVIGDGYGFGANVAITLLLHQQGERNFDDLAQCIANLNNKSITDEFHMYLQDRDAYISELKTFVESHGSLSKNFFAVLQNEFVAGKDAFIGAMIVLTLIQRIVNKNQLLNIACKGGTFYRTDECGKLVEDPLRGGRVVVEEMIRERRNK